jgi:hypothetical protein
MMRISTLIWTLLVVLAGYAMFQVKYEVSQLDDRLGRVNRQIVADQERIHTLKAEWAVLTQPKRLQELTAHAALPLTPIGTKVLGALDKPPMRALVSNPEPAQIAEVSLKDRP